MTETLKSTDDLLASITDNEQQLNSAQDIRDIIYSLSGVGAAAAGAEANPTSYNELVPKGLELIAPRRFRVLEGGAGVYQFLAQGSGSISGAPGGRNLVRAAWLVNDEQDSQNFIKPAFFYVDDNPHNYIEVWDIHRVEEGDEIRLEFFVGGGQSLSNVEYMVAGLRAG